MRVWLIISLGEKQILKMHALQLKQVINEKLLKC